MALLAPTEGELIMLERVINKGPFTDPVLRLYTNDLTPADADVLADFTELNKAGYAARVLTGSVWDVTAVGATGQATFNQITFTLTGQCTAYGYYISNTGPSEVLWSERFTDGPYVIPSGGGTIKVTPYVEFE